MFPTLTLSSAAITFQHANRIFPYFEFHLNYLFYSICAGPAISVKNLCLLFKSTRSKTESEFGGGVFIICENVADRKSVV